MGQQAPWGVAAPATAGQATASFVLGLIGVIACLAFVPSLLAVVFGIIALNRIKSSVGTIGGRGLAIAGIILGAMGILVGIGFWALVATDTVQEGFREGFNEATAFGFEGIAVGDCVSVPDATGNVLGLNEEPCGLPHDGEVYLRGSLPGTEFPGEAASQSQTETACYDEFERYVGLSHDESIYDIFYFYPKADSWDLGDRGYICILIDPTEAELPAGSLRGVAE